MNSLFFRDIIPVRRSDIVERIAKFICRPELVSGTEICDSGKILSQVQDDNVLCNKSSPDRAMVQSSPLGTLPSKRLSIVCERGVERGINVKSPLIPLYKGGKEARQLGSEAAKHSENISFAKQTEKVYSPLTTHYSLCKKAAFTLAETLITLGIIGVVAAMTLPTLIYNYKKRVVGTKLAKFYSIMNQALLTSKSQKGELSFEQVYLEDSEYLTNWYRENITKYINTVKDEGPEKSSTYYRVAFIDGSGFNSYYSGMKSDGSLGNLYVFYCLNYNKCNLGSFNGKDTFLFIIKVEDARMFTYGTDNSREQLLTDCAIPSRNWGCATLIMRNNWVVPDDYPIRF